MAEVGHIIDVLGDVDYQDSETGVIYVKNVQTGKVVKVADLVNDEPREREKISTYLRTHAMEDIDAIDIIIALGMAKEGFDWPYCEHALTIGYRGSLTEIIQIIGRATRDSSNKTHAQFTNLIAEPEAEETEVKIAVNNMLKAITASLLMEQVLAPNFNFKLKSEHEDDTENDKKNDSENTIRVRGLKTPTSQRAKDIIEQDLNDLKAKILQDDTMLKALPGNVEPEVINKVLIPKIIKEIYPDIFSDDENVYYLDVYEDWAKRSGNNPFSLLKGSFNETDKQKRQDAISKARKGVSNVAVPTGTIEKRDPLDVTKVKVGDVVFLDNLQSLGTILAIQGKRIQVDMNGLTVTVKEKDLLAATREEASALLRKENPVPMSNRQRKRSGMAGFW